MNKNLLILVIFAGILFEYQFIYSPNIRKIKNLNNLLTKKEKEYQEFLFLCEEYKKREIGEAKRENFKTVSKNFSFFSYLNDLIEKINLKSNMGEIKILPKENKNDFIIEKLKISINLISIEQLVSFLNSIEKTEGVYITQLEMQRNKEKPSLLDIEIVIMCLKK